MIQSRRTEAPAQNFLKNCALLFCLFAPSVWMIATIPPLWRDLDAYSQLTLRPLVTTFWGHAPAYSYLAKVPLFLGEQFERWRGIAGAGAESGLPQLTDTGVWLLIGAQHLALGAAVFYFILSISQVFWIRLALAVTWASNAVFYTFAHCTGSESLSVVVVVLLVAKGLRLIRSRREPRWIDWYLFAIVLWLCLLSRHANVWLILLLPAAFILSWAHYRVAGLFTSGAPRRRRGRLRSKYLRQAIISLAIGVVCFGVAHSWMQYVARKTKFHPHSRLGHTLMWRLQFLTTLPPPQRAALLQKVAARADSPDTRALVNLLAQMHDEGAGVFGRPFMERASALLFPGEVSIPWEKLDLAVNKMAYAFLLPPTPEHWQVARTEFLASLKMSGTDIPDWLIITTAYFFDHKDEMPACATLVTFRDNAAETIIGIPARYPYFRLWRGLSYNKAALIWLGSLLLLIIVGRQKKKNIGVIASLGIALIAIGLLMTASACLVTEFLPRYALPMWQLLLLSLYIFVGTGADLIATSKEKSAGQLPRLG